MALALVVMAVLSIGRGGQHRSRIGGNGGGTARTRGWRWTCPRVLPHVGLIDAAATVIVLIIVPNAGDRLAIVETMLRAEIATAC